jgi:hypothetical protein
MTTRLALFAVLMLATSAASAQAPRARPAPPAAAKPPAAGVPQGAASQEVTDPAAFRAFTATPLYQSLVKRALDGVPPEIFQRCPALVSNSSKITILRPLHFADDTPVGGGWKHSFPVSGCGPDTILNFYFMATPDRRINILIGPPGTTHADPAMLHDAQAGAFNAAAGAPHDPGKAPCASYLVRNTKFEGFGLEDPPTPDPGSADPHRPWRESWTVSGCGHTFLVPLNFLPRPGGTAVMQPGHVTELTPSDLAQAVPHAAPLPAGVPSAPPPRPEPSPNAAPPASPSPAPPASPSPAPPAANFAPLPGSTHVNLRQQSEAQTRTFSAAASALQEQGGTPCPSYTITSTKFEAFGLEYPPTPDPGPAAPERPWWESWTATGCGRQFLVPLNFVPHGGEVDIVQPGHVSQPLLVDPSQIHNPYAKDDPAPPAPPPAAKP